MSESPLADIVSSQYEKWVYPEPIRDLPAWLAHNWQWFDPSHAHRLFWPDRSYKPDLDILIAGCGTNQAAVFAYTNPGARVLAIDVSGPSLEHHQFLKDKYGLRNLELQRLPIEEAGGLDRDFDLIVSTGVLHHMAQPEAGLQALAACLRPNGVVGLMLYARYGRIGVELLQALFRELGLQQDEASLLTVKETLALLPQEHPIRQYLSLAPDLQFDAGLVDTFLHGRDRSYTVGDCLDLVASAGLVFQDWFLKAPYYPPVGAQDRFHAAVAALPVQQQWSVMEKIRTRNACHFFTACHAQRPLGSCRVDFASVTALDYVPAFRYRCGMDGQAVFRPDWRIALEAGQEAVLRNVDGQRTLRQLVEAAANAGPLAQRSAPEREAYVRNFMRSLWENDFVSMGSA